MDSRAVLTLLFATLTIAWPAPTTSAAEGDTAGRRMADAATAFIDVLSERQREMARLDYDDDLRTHWHYWPWPLVERKGLMLRDMNKQQREHAMALLKSSLSEVGYRKAVVTMDLENILHEIEYDGAVRDPLRYHVTIYGEPASEGTWGWSIEGHHLVFNFVVRDGELVNVTPAFMGASPAEVRENAGVGPEVGTRNMEDEDALAFDLIGTLSETQHEQVVVASTSEMDMDEAHRPQTERIEPPGLSASQMTEGQRDILRQLIATYIRNVPDELADPYLARVDEELTETHFAWFGPTDGGSGGEGYSYRIQSPTFMIVLYNNQADPSGNHPNHVHSVWRTFEKDFAPALD